jgi:hypothetical protein
LDREAQKFEIYFTNHTLTGKPNAFPWLGSDTARRFHGPREALPVRPSFAECSPSLFHQSHFDWEAGGLFVSGSQTPPCDPQATLSVQKVGREVLAAFI